MRRGDEQPCTLRRFARHSNVAGRRPIIRVALARSALDRSQMLLGDIAEHPRPSPEAVRVQYTTHPQLVFRLVFRRQGLRFGRRQGRRCVDLRTLPAVLPNGRPQGLDGFAELFGETRSLMAFEAGEAAGIDDCLSALADPDVIEEIKTAIRTVVLPRLRRHVDTLRTLRAG